MNLFPFVPLSSVGDGTSRDLLLNLALKRHREKQRQRKKRGVSRDIEILRGVGREIQNTERGAEGEKAKKRVEKKREVRETTEINKGKGKHR